jgi:hypothetical protein
LGLIHASNKELAVLARNRVIRNGSAWLIRGDLR